MTPLPPAIDRHTFTTAFYRFKRLIEAHDQGHPFTGFHEGVAAVWEGYKPRIHKRGNELLNTSTWTEDQIGSGEILDRTISAIEIDDRRSSLINNLTTWQNRWGHANRDHRSLLDTVSNPGARRAVERMLFDLYVAGGDEGDAFSHLSDFVGAKYPLLAYLFFLKDMDRFMPINPTGFDAAFRELGIDLKTRQACSWDNYSRYNLALEAVRNSLGDVAGLSNPRLVDAHSFCWMLVKLEDADHSDRGTAPTRSDTGRVLGARERSIADMKYGIINTVGQARGQTVTRQVQMKLKELRMTPDDLERFLRERLEVQGDRCALTGIPFQFNGPDSDPNLLPSPDRIDSDGHYERDNLQLVCRFVNFWKSAQPDDEFRRLLMLVQGNPNDYQHSP